MSVDPVPLRAADAIELDLFLEAVMPRLAALGLARRAYASTTFAGNLGLA